MQLHEVTSLASFGHSAATQQLTPCQLHVRERKTVGEKKEVVFVKDETTILHGLRGIHDLADSPTVIWDHSSIPAAAVTVCEIAAPRCGVLIQHLLCFLGSDRPA